MEKVPQILFLVSSEKELTYDQLMLLKHSSKLIGLDPTIKGIDNNIKNYLNTKIFCFDYIYLAGHSNDETFGSLDNQVSWESVANLIQETGISCKATTLIIKSCMSGSKRIADLFFDKVNNLEHIIGFKNPVVNMDSFMTTLFLFYYLKKCNFQNIEKSVKFASNITNLEFLYFSRNGAGPLKK